jgi:hypothetical protein
LGLKERLVWKKENSPLLQRLTEIHGFCATKWKSERGKERSKWLLTTGKFGKLKERFPVVYEREILFDMINWFKPIGSEIRRIVRAALNELKS